MKEQKNKVSFFHSIKVKILLLVFGTVLSSVVICIATAVPLSSNSVSSLTESYGRKLVRHWEDDVKAQGYDVIMTPEILEQHLGGVKVRGMDSSYAYLVSSDSMMLYHPTPEKIGQPVENEAVKQLVAEIAQGNRPETDVIIYDFKGVTKYASFYIDPDMKFILVVTASSVAGRTTLPPSNSSSSASQPRMSAAMRQSCFFSFSQASSTALPVR